MTLGPPTYVPYIYHAHVVHQRAERFIEVCDRSKLKSSHFKVVLKMSESKAAEDYKVFESLRNRFSDSNNNSSPSRPEPRKQSKRRFDPRSNAPPLVPLIEEGDQLQDEIVSLCQYLRRGRGW